MPLRFVPLMEILEATRQGSNSVRRTGTSAGVIDQSIVPVDQAIALIDQNLRLKNTFARFQNGILQALDALNGRVKRRIRAPKKVQRRSERIVIDMAHYTVCAARTASAQWRGSQPVGFEAARRACLNPSDSFRSRSGTTPVLLERA